MSLARGELRRHIRLPKTPDRHHLRRGRLGKAGGQSQEPSAAGGLACPFLLQLPVVLCPGDVPGARGAACRNSHKREETARAWSLHLSPCALPFAPCSRCPGAFGRWAAPKRACLELALLCLGVHGDRAQQGTCQAATALPCTAPAPVTSPGTSGAGVWGLTPQLLCLKLFPFL